MPESTDRPRPGPNGWRGGRPGAGRPVAPVGRSVDALRRQFGLGGLDAFDTIAATWPEVVPSGAEGRCEVIDLRGGVLRVDAADPATAEVLRWSRQRVLARLREVCPDERIVDLRVSVRTPGGT